eukprot:TRINITY_DN38456_c0_g1_i1.p1 TRINITY_DN38456_c0_g1~~TRINITY_DN38456_c0_g1_i1.p1  ORF type:complete len:383 (+),score=75.36 TRINITY_DN38456_c0_g1_i1:37-1185(+)
MAVARVIAAAIEQGAPAYNAGQVAVCASLYAEAASRLLQSHSEELSANVRSQLQKTLDESNRTPLGGSQGKAAPADQLAWSFRRAFDAQLALRQRPAEEQLERGPAREVAEAIAQGAPMYNRGDITGCVRVYTATAQSLLRRPDLGKEVRETLRAALKQCGDRPGDDNGNAWMLRRALDGAAAAPSSGLGALDAEDADRGQKGVLLRNFSLGSGLDLQGSCVNDTVMGGRSNSRFRLTSEGAVFEGAVTKQGGGGFVSLRLQGPGGALVQALRGRRGVAFNVRSLEGCTAWKLQLNEGMGGTQWQAGFTAPTRDTETLKLPFSAFVPTWRGMPQGGRGITDQELSRIQGVGFMLSFLEDDGSKSATFREGKFSLLINWIASY